MATWDELVQYVKTQYTVAKDDGTGMWLHFRTSDGRSQLVRLWHQELDNTEWVQIESPIGQVDKTKPVELLREVGTLILGGLILEEDMLWLRHTVPLANLDANEFEDPFAMVVHAADLLEQRWLGGDEH